MSSQSYGSIGFSEDFSLKGCEDKQRALEGLRHLLLLTYPSDVTEGFDAAVAEFQEESGGLDVISTEEILRLKVPVSRRFEFERLGFKIYSVVECC